MARNPGRNSGPAWPAVEELTEALAMARTDHADAVRLDAIAHCLDRAITRLRVPARPGGMAEADVEMLESLFCRLVADWRADAAATGDDPDVCLSTAQAGALEEALALARASGQARLTELLQTALGDPAEASQPPRRTGVTLYAEFAFSARGEADWLVAHRRLPRPDDCRVAFDAAELSAEQLRFLTEHYGAAETAGRWSTSSPGHRFWSVRIGRYTLGYPDWTDRVYQLLRLKEMQFEWVPLDEPPSLDAVFEHLRRMAAEEQAIASGQVEREQALRQLRPADGEAFDFVAAPLFQRCGARGQFIVGHLSEADWERRLDQCGFLDDKLQSFLRQLENLEDVLKLLACRARGDGTIEAVWTFYYGAAHKWLLVLKSLERGGVLRLDTASIIGGKSAQTAAR